MQLSSEVLQVVEGMTVGWEGDALELEWECLWLHWSMLAGR